MLCAINGFDFVLVSTASIVQVTVELLQKSRQIVKRI